jgi:hypothetical protein
MTPEGRIKSACLRYLERRHIKAWNNPTGATQIRPGQWLRFGQKGSADILGCLPDGRFLAVECKAGRGRLSPEQRDFLDEIQGLGGLAVVARSCQELDGALNWTGHSGERDTLPGV